jgi:hypothetical protein
MDRTTPPEAGGRDTGIFVPVHPIRTIPLVALGMSLGLFFVISYGLCVLLYLLFPDWILNHAVLALFLPGFEWLSWHSFLLGLVESFGYGWYIALVFAPLYNVFVAWSR